MIHENVCESQKTNSISFEAETLWYRILTRVDDNGNYYRDARRVFPAVMLEKKNASEALVEKWLRELLKIELIAIFEADGREYLHIVDFEKYQDLRQDGYASVQYPIHPLELGQGYTKEGRRSSVLRTESAPQKAVREQSLSSSGRVFTGPSEIEVEVKGEVEGEVVSSSHREGKFNNFRDAFKRALGRATKPKPYTSHVEKYQELCRRNGENEVLDAINSFVSLHGKQVLLKNKYADRDFLMDECQDLIDAKKNGTLDSATNDSEDRSSEPSRPKVQI